MVTRFLIYTIFPLGTALFLVFAVMVLYDISEAPDIAYLQHYHHGAPVEIYDREDELVCAINPLKKKRNVELNEISNDMIQAVLAVEDRQFFEHQGVSFMGIARAMWANVQARKMVQGGSTITQQLVKNLFFEGEKRTAVRKVSEAIIAFSIEQKYTKEQILKFYLNEIYFGNGSYGVDQAAAVYFAKTPFMLNSAESAFLAGLIKSPSYFGDPSHRIEALQRQKQVLRLMAENGYITASQYDLAMVTPIRFARAREVNETEAFTKYPYFVSYVLELLKQIDPSSVNASAARRGLRVYTTLDQPAQKLAERSLSAGIGRAPYGITEGALVSLSVFDGAVRALVGGAGDYWKNQWNCATNPHTAGSVFKPFVYLAAFRKGVLDPYCSVEDTKLSIPQIGGVTYTPKNFDGRFMGRITVKEALAQSRNVCAVKVARQIGMECIVETAKLAGIKSELSANLSLALGSSAVTPLELAGAYATFARGGLSIEPWLIRRIATIDGKTIKRFEPVQSRALEPQPVAMLNSILKEVVDNGTGVAARLPNRPVAGKTGTADHSTDLWFVGFTPDLVTAVWAGSRDHSNVYGGKRVTGGTVAATIFRDYNVGYYKAHPGPPGTLISSASGSVPMGEREKDKERERAAAESKANAAPLLSAAPPRAYKRGTYRSRRRSQSNSDYNQRYAAYLRRYYAQRSANPNGGYVTRSQKGVKEYTWTR